MASSGHIQLMKWSRISGFWTWSLEINLCDKPTIIDMSEFFMF